MKKIHITNRKRVFVFSLLIVTCLTLPILAGCYSFIKANDDFEYSTGFVPLSDEEYEALPKLQTKVAKYSLPSSVDLTNQFPKPSTWGQGTEQPSCVAWAVAYAYKSSQKKLDFGWDLERIVHRFSPSYVFNQIYIEGDKGITVKSAMDLIVKQGVCSLDDMSYSQYDYKTQPTQAQRQAASRYKGLYYWALIAGDIYTMKDRLAYRDAVVIDININDDLEYLNKNNPIYDKVDKSLKPCHVVCLIGYDDKMKAFKFINSWGTNWGIDGYGYISYDMVKECSTEAYCMMDNIILQDPGCLDEVNTSVIGGWAINDYYGYDRSSPISVHTHIIDDSTNTILNVLVTTANIYRADVGPHGFNQPISWLKYKPGRYRINTYAIYDINPLLRSSPKYFTVRNMEAIVDYFGMYGISGWGWKPDAPNNATEVHVYIYDSSNKLVYSAPITANQYRRDLEQAGVGNGYHGFSFDIPWSTIPKGILQVNVYAVDYSGYHPMFFSTTYNNH